MSGASYSGGDPSNGLTSDDVTNTTNPFEIQACKTNGRKGWMLLIPGQKPIFVDAAFANKIARRILFSKERFK